MIDATAKPVPVRVVGRYAIYNEIAAGGMATVHLGRLIGPVGFARTVAIKRLYAHYAKDPEFVAMFLDEARLAARIQHPNVVQTLDVVPNEGDLFLVMEYVPGESLARLLFAANQQERDIPPAVVSSIIVGMLHGLHAAHEAKSEHGEPLNLVHRDVSPQNVLVAIDGIARVLDFGIAKAAMRAHSTPGGQMKGKLSYMAPEQLMGSKTDRRADVFAAGIVLWETLTGRRLFDGDDQGEVVAAIVNKQIPAPSTLADTVSKALDDVAIRALSRDRDARFQDAREFAIALEKAVPPATTREVGEWVEAVVGGSLAARAEKVGQIESISAQSDGPLVRVEGVSPDDKTDVGLTQPRLSADRLSIRASSPSIATGAFATSRRRRLVAVFGVLVLMGSAGAAMALLAMRGIAHETRAEGAAADPANELDPTTSPAPLAASEPAADETTRADELDGSPGVPAAAGAEASPEQPAAEPTQLRRSRASSPRRWTPPPKPPPLPRSRPPATGGCNPPYIVDANGIKRLKPQCL